MRRSRYAPPGRDTGCYAPAGWNSSSELPEGKRQTLLAAGAPPALADAMDELFIERRKGSMHETLGLRPTTFQEVAGRNAAVFRDGSAVSSLSNEVRATGP